MTILSMKHRKFIEDEPTLDQETVDALKAWVNERKGPEMVRMLDELGWFEFVRPSPYILFGIYHRDLNPSTIALMLRHIFLYNPKVLFYIARRDITFKRKAIAKTDFINVIMEECRVWKYISGELIDILIGSEFDIIIADRGIQLLRPRWMSKEEKVEFNARLVQLRKELYGNAYASTRDDEDFADDSIKNREIHEVFALFEDEIEELKKNPKKILE